MIIFRTDFLPARGQSPFNRTIYLASQLRQFNAVYFSSASRFPGSGAGQKNQISFYELKQIHQSDNRVIRGIIFDLNEFSTEDLDLLEWARDNQLLTVQITDLGMNQKPVDFTIDASVESMIPYADHKAGLFGPDFCILHHKYRHFNRLKHEPRRVIRKIFLHTGNSLTYRQTRKMIDVLNRNRFHLSVHLGPWQKKSHRKILKRIYPAIHFTGPVDSLARSFFQSDVSLIQPGESAFCAAACGTPAIYICSNREQEYAAGVFEKKGVGLKAGIDSMNVSCDIMEKLNLLSCQNRKEISLRGKGLVDALGVYRIIDFFRKKHMIGEGPCLKSD